MNRPFTKRRLGRLMLVVGVATFVGVLSIDLVDVGREGGIGPVQAIVLAGCVLVAVVGATLIPLGDRPA
ncbi:MAG: hypothetical protein JXB47_15630 [Anaerolineae bacterium]|nr:hypothetical protein [Anaerolineae bacterium]